MIDADQLAEWAKLAAEAKWPETYGQWALEAVPVLLAEVQRYADMVTDLGGVVKDVCKERDAALTRVAALETALRKYGRHGPLCWTFLEGGADDRECICGLDTALSPGLPGKGE